MKILVIGNGFDLEHGLPTKYNDFLRYIKIIRSLPTLGKGINEELLIKKLTEDNDYLQKYCLEVYENRILNKDKIINELIELSENNIWMNYFIKLNFNENKGWIDFESEISNVIRSLDNMKKYRYKTKIGKDININKDKEADSIENRIERIIGNLPKRIEYLNKDEYNEKITKVLQQHLDNLIRCLEIYLEDYVRKIGINNISPDIKDIEFNKVLSFNYTNTYERVYANNNDEVEYEYIHGKADITRYADENNMVLGIDEYLDEESKNKELEFIHFKKYFQRIYKKTGNIYKKWIEEIESIERQKREKKEFHREIISTTKLEIQRQVSRNIIENLNSNSNKDKSEICIFGHSLDITDKDIIKELIECPNTETTIFYYDKGVYAQQIANMVKIIGQDELIKRVSGANPTIIFKQQQKRIEKNIKF